MICPDDYRTPKYVLDWIERHIGAITHDGACNELLLSKCGYYNGDGNKVAQPIDIMTDVIPAEAHVFINPPWDSPTIIRMVKRAMITSISNCKFTFLLPNKLCQKSWVENVNVNLSGIVFMGGRINFEGPNALRKGASRHGCILGVIDRKIKTFRVSHVTLEKMRGEYNENV